MIKFSGKLCQMLAVVTGTLTAISDGMHYGWSSPIVSVLKSPSSPVPIEDSDIVWLENLVMLGGLSGLPITILMLDKLGRKRTMLIAAVENLIAWTLIAFATSPKVLFIARFICGIAADVNFVAAPVYIAEISDKKIRGRLGSVINVFTLIGVVLIYSIGPFVAIATSCGIGAAFLITELLTFSSMPESPYYLLVRNKKDDARKSLKLLRSSYAEDELNEMEGVVQRENHTRGRPFDLITIGSNRKALLIMAVLNFSQHFSGITVMIMNLHMILEDAGSIVKPNTAAIEFSVLMLVACAISASLIDTAGRRFLLYTSSFLTAIVLLILASYFAAKNNGVDISDYTWVPVAALMTYAIVHKFGLGLIPIVVTAELFPTNVKAIGVTLADATYVITSSLSIYIFHTLVRNFGMHVPFFLFAACSILTGLFAIFLLPETKGKSLDEIQQLLKGEKVNVQDDTSKVLLSTESINQNANYGT